MTQGPTTLVALLNAMIGGTILVLPMLFKSAGLIPSFIATLISALAGYYSCKICYDHVREGEDMPEAIFRHTNSKLMSDLYDGLMWLSYLFILLLYFNLIVDQWKTLLNSSSFVITLANAILLIFLTILMEKFNFGVNLLAYGMISILSYLAFLAWTLYDSQNLEKKNQMPIFSWNFAILCDTLNTGFNMQGIFIALLNKNYNPQQNNLLLVLLYVIGFIIYAYIGHVGSYAILNRRVYNQKVETIQRYFRHGQLPVMSICIIYLIHLYSVYPEFLIISQKFLFGLLGWTQQSKWRNRLYAATLITIFCTINYVGFSMESILAINGTILGFLFVYAMPIWLHMKCVYFTDEESMDKCQQMSVTEQVVHLVFMSAMLVFGVAIFIYSVKGFFDKYV